MLPNTFITPELLWYPYPNGGVFSYWNDALNFLMKLRAATNMRFEGKGIPFADCVTIKRPTGRENVELNYSVYYKGDEGWFQETKPALMFAEAVPEKILAKADGAEEEVDITDYIENEWEASK